MKISITLILLFFIQTAAQALTLKQTLEQAQNHPQMKNIQLDVELAEQDYTGALLGWTPTVSIERDWLQSGGNSQTVFNSADSFSVSARLNLFKGLGDVGNTRSRYYSRKAARAEGEQEWITTQLTVAEVFFRCASEMKLLEKAKRAVKIRTDLEAIAKRRFDRGSLAKDEYIKLKIDRNLEENNLRQQQHALTDCRADLSYWVGESLTSEIISPDLMTSISRLTTEAADYQDHPDWQSVSNEAKSSRWQVWAEGGDLWPQLDLNYNFEPKTSFQSEDKTLLLTASWDIFDGGEDWTGYRKSRINFQKSQNLVSDFERQWTRRFESAQSQLREQLIIYKTNTENSKLAEEILQASLRRFRLGSVSSNEVALDQNRLIGALRAEWQSWFALHQNWLQLLSVRGEKVEKYL